jgi:HEAT repeat protein
MSVLSALSSFTEGPRRYIAVGVGIVLVLLAAFFLFSRDDGLDNSPVRDVIRAGNKGNVSKLNEFVKDPDINKATEALAQLARVQKQAARPLMEEKLSDPRAEMRQAAALQLGLIGDGKNPGPLVRALKDPDPSVRIAACKSLGKLNASAAAIYMLPLIEKDSPQVQENALMAVNTAMGVDFGYKLSLPLAERQKKMANMRKFASVLAAKSGSKPMDMTKSN